MKPVLIIKTGQTIETAFAKVGDFERWIIKGMQAEEDNFKVVEVYNAENLPTLDEVSGAVITGSPAMVTDKLEWSEYTAEWLRQAVKFQLPMLGICYGHQLLAHALGGRVDFNSLGREIGTTTVAPLPESSEDALFSKIKEPFNVHVSHMQSVVALPLESKVLASNNFDQNHAVKFSKQCWGLQFHPEFGKVAMQCYIEERQDDLRKEGLNVETLLKEVKGTPVAQKILADFYKLIQNY